MIKIEDIKVGAKFRAECGVVFVINEVKNDPVFGTLVRSRMDGEGLSSSSQYRDKIEDVVNFLNEEKAIKIKS